MGKPGSTAVGDQGRLPKDALTPAVRAEHRRLALDAVQLKARLIRAGLLKTGHAMEFVTQQVG